MAYLKLIRWPNLVLIVFAQFLAKYTLLEPFGVPITLNWFGITLLALSTVCIAAAGYIIEAIYNIKADEINKPNKIILTKKVPIKKANKLFFIFNITGVLIGFYLSNIIEYPSFAILFILASALLYANASSLKKYAVISPLVVGLLMGLSLFSVGLFDLFPAITDQTRTTASTFFSIILDYALLFAILVFLHNLVKEQLSKEGDHKLKRQTLPLLFGKKRANIILFILTLIPISGVVYYTLKYLYSNPVFPIYAMIFVLAPLFYILIKLISAEHKKDFIHISFVFKLVMFFSILSLGLYQFILG